MGGGQAPPGIDLGSRPSIDEGTLARMRSPSPGPIGFEAKGGGKSGGLNIRDDILAFAEQHRGEQVGDGSCFDLVDRALREADALSAEDFARNHRVGRNDNYVWGTEIQFSLLQPGDVVQFLDYSYQRVVRTGDADNWTERTDSQERPHHSAIVRSVDGANAVTVWEQNYPPHAPVRSIQLFFQTGNAGSADPTITIQGTVWFYHPMPRPSSSEAGAGPPGGGAAGGLEL